MKGKRGKAVMLSVGVLLPGMFRVLGEVLGETMQTSIFVPLVALAACVGIAGISIYLVARAIP